MTGRSLLAGLFAALLAGTAVAQGVTVDVRLERDKIHVGESVWYLVTVRGGEEVEDPNLKGFDEFDVTPGGRESMSQFVNGVVTSEVRFRFRLRPKREGRLVVPAPTVTVGGTTLTGRALELEVVQPEAQDVVFAVISAEPERVYPIQAFTVTLTIFVHKLPGEQADTDPLRVTRPAQLQIPWVQPLDGLETDSVSDWLSSRILRRGRSGFHINDVTAQDSMFFENSRAVFDLKGRPATRADAAALAQLGDRAEEYWVYTLPRRFTAERSASYAFGPVTLKGRFATGLRDGRLTGREIYVVAKAIRVRVRDVPEAGKPPGYTGAVGEFQVAAQIAPAKARVGDPMTLTLTVTGSGNLDEIGPPPLEDALGEKFKIYEATSASKEDARVFTYALRPRAASVDAISPIPFSYFDVVQERYVVLRTNRMAVEIGEAEALDDGEIVSAERTALRGGLEASEEGIFANRVDPRELGWEEPRPFLAFAYVAFLALLYAGACGCIARRRRLHSDPAFLRRRGAAGRARQNLRDAETAPEADRVRRLRDTVAGLVADAADIPASGVTGRDAAEHLRALGTQDTLAKRAEVFLELCDGHRYGAPSSAAGDVADDARSLVDDLIGDLKRRGRLR